MQETNATHEHPAAELSGAPAERGRRRHIVVLTGILALLLFALVPPYINVNRFQRRVARNISASLGRAVHFDRISLTLLPFPSFTLENFVVDEDPAFGSEPILRANEVRATPRISSLWSRHVEFSNISLTDPSVNLVHSSNGQWNIEGLLLQVSHVDAAPTAQKHAGPAPRFPYIEATGARLNLKVEQVKTAYSLTDADFALWLPESHQWRLHLVAHPVRTDTSPGDTGTLHVEATFGAANTPSGSLAQVPLDLHGEWQNVQLGALSRLLIADDAGLRGDLTLSFNILGSLGQNSITTDIKLANVRRADFVPPHLLDLDADCKAVAQNTFHTLSNLVCRWPPSGSGPSNLILTANLPDIHRPSSASATLMLTALPASTFLDWISVATPHPPTGLTGPGNLSGSLTWNASNSEPQPAQSQRRLASHRQLQVPQSLWTGRLEFSGESLQIPALGPKPIPLGVLLLRTTLPLPAQSSGQRSASSTKRSADAIRFDLLPVSLPLGGHPPAILEGHFDATGSTLHLSGAVLAARLLSLGDAIPPFGEGLKQILEPIESANLSAVRSAQSMDTEEGLASAAPEANPIHIDLTATRRWGGPQVWSQTGSSPPKTRRRTGR